MTARWTGRFSRSGPVAEPTRRLFKLRSAEYKNASSTPEGHADMQKFDATTNPKSESSAKAIDERRAWAKPLLDTRKIKDITRSGSGSGTDGGTVSGMTMVSDARLKKAIRVVGRSPSGLGVYEFKYVWGGPTRVGGMAQEIAQHHPDAIWVGSDGFMRVDYSLTDIDPA